MARTYVANWRQSHTRIAMRVDGARIIAIYPDQKEIRMNELGHKIKLGIIAILVILVLIISLQNTANVETKLLFATVTMPRAYCCL